jgi:hypothetical protein
MVRTTPFSVLAGATNRACARTSGWALSIAYDQCAASSMPMSLK